MKSNSTAFGLIAGASIAVIVTLIVCTWEWIENPSGLFHGAEGTSWNFVFETAVSWFVPTFLAAATSCFTVHLLYRWIRFDRKDD